MEPFGTPTLIEAFKELDRSEQPFAFYHLKNLLKH